MLFDPRQGVHENDCAMVHVSRRFIMFIKAEHIMIKLFQSHPTARYTVTKSYPQRKFTSSQPQ